VRSIEESEPEVGGGRKIFYTEIAKKLKEHVE
jgi:hypothetical protein